MSFPSQAFNGTCTGKLIPKAVWQTACHQLHDFLYLAALIHTTQDLKFVIPCNPSFTEEVLCYLQESFATVRVKVSV
jgi:hypothetical protein